MILFALGTLGIGIFSMLSDGTITLLLPIAKLSTLPISLLGITVFIFIIIFNAILGLGLIATGLFIGLNSDVMYLPAILGVFIGLVGYALLMIIIKAYPINIAT